MLYVNEIDKRMIHVDPESNGIVPFQCFEFNINIKYIEKSKTLEFYHNTKVPFVAEQII